MGTSTQQGMEPSRLQRRGWSGTMTIGSPYAALAWSADAHPSRSLPINVQRMPGTPTAQDVGVAPMHALPNARAAWTHALERVAADGTYGNGRCMSRVRGVRGGGGMAPRVRADRVVDRPAAPTPGNRGRPSTDGERLVPRRTHLGDTRRRAEMPGCTRWPGTPEPLVGSFSFCHNAFRLSPWGVGMIHDHGAPPIA
jgi:hypothetical protein